MTKLSISSTSWAIAAIGLLASLAASCNQAPKCSELGTCGGAQPDGYWMLNPAHVSCSEDLYVPPADTRLVKADTPAARLPPPDEALFDWCDLLVTNGGTDIATIQPRFSFEDGPIGSAWVHYYDAVVGTTTVHKYAAGLTRTGTYTIHFPALCMREFGAMDNASGSVCTQLAAQVKQTPSHRNILCIPDPEDAAGCFCQFDVSATAGGSGTYRGIDSHTIVHTQDVRFALPINVPAADFPHDATYCNKTNSLELTGANGAYLFDTTGLRTLDLAKVDVNCKDGVKGVLEEGVDCGLVCDDYCFCHNGVKEMQEEGVDCGPICKNVCPPAP